MGAMISLAKRRVIAALVVTIAAGAAWYSGRPRVPAGQPPIVTLDAPSFSTLRDTFNADADHVRIFLLQSPT